MRPGWDLQRIQTLLRYFILPGKIKWSKKENNNVNKLQGSIKDKTKQKDNSIKTKHILAILTNVSRTNTH